MSTKTFIQPDSTSQSAANYPGILDAAVSVLARPGDSFAPHAQSTPDMTVALDAGHLMNGQTLVEQAAQSTGAITAPATNPRIDRIVVDNATGVVSVVAGVEAPSPAAPVIPAGKSPVAQVLLQTSTMAITNAMLTDERDFFNLGSSAGSLINVQTFTSSGTYTPTPGTNKIIVEVLGAGASGGGCAATTASTGSGASGGGAGAYGKALITSGFAGATVTVGVGGSAPAAGANDGTDGGNSSFGALVVAGGGKHGRGSIAFTPPITLGSSGATSLPTGANIVGATGAQGGSSFILATNAVTGGMGAASYFGSGGLQGGAAPGGTAVTPGSGGGGASSGASSIARAGGAGANGIVIVHEYA